MLRKNYAYIPTVGLRFGSALAKSIAVQLACSGGMVRLLACVLFNIGGSLLDDGVNFRPLE